MQSMKDYKAPKPGRIERFLWWCCGADAQILKMSTYADYAKYSGLGGIVLATGILATFAMGFAIQRVFENTGLAIFIGILWGCIIFNLDRFIISSTGKGDGKHDISWGEFWHALPRLIMATIIGFTISGPLEIYIFQKEIDKQWEIRKDEEKANARKEAANHRQQDEADLRTAMQKIESEKAVLLEQVNRLTTMIADETTRKRCGPICEGHKQQKAELQREVQKKEADIERINNQISGILQERSDQVALRESKFSGKLGLLDSLSALHSYPGSFWPVWLIRLLFVFVEVAPVFFKLMIAYSPYDYLQDNLKFIILANQGIQSKEGYSKLEDGRIYDQVVYHEAEMLWQQKMEKLKADLYLHGRIVDKYKDTESKNIEQNPEEYIQKRP